ncbi:flavin reductase family protein [Flavimarina sp. Hel_I_48]|uniref:flavin reductase family protein n=1 Tax=Flavimarina sp. Hel_I_48 TaxID=1392488 RepID=UPI0004DFC458|nr:flavin reductase family protein [Flavimarina sp. Hel_I_48]
MQYYSLEDLNNLPSRDRAHFINSCTGYKSANLLGTVSKDGLTNVAIFSSVIHLGSNPPLLGFILRPTTIARNTYDNLKKTGVFTVNHVNENIVRAAHQTSAKYPGEVTEFDKVDLNTEFLNDFKAPYVQESKIKLGCAYTNEYFIEENDCLFIIGAIKHIHIAENIQREDGWLDLEAAKTVSINGLDGYALPHLLERLSYAKPDKDLKSLNKDGA